MASYRKRPAQDYIQNRKIAIAVIVPFKMAILKVTK